LKELGRPGRLKPEGHKKFESEEVVSTRKGRTPEDAPFGKGVKVFVKGEKRGGRRYKTRDI